MGNNKDSTRSIIITKSERNNRTIHKVTFRLPIILQTCIHKNKLNIFINYNNKISC